MRYVNSSGGQGGSHTDNGLTDYGEFAPGINLDMSTSASMDSGTGSYGLHVQLVRQICNGVGNPDAVYPIENCKITVNISCSGTGTAIFAINGETKYEDTGSNHSPGPYSASFNLTPNDYISGKCTVSASNTGGPSSTNSGSVTYTVTVS